jgi:hypothetical protein
MLDRSPGRRELGLALGLFLLAPLVGEYLFGNTPITELPALLLLAPLYGGGALLIREVARRAGRGWATMVLLAAAYALFEEGPVDQMLWNPHYGGIPFGLVYAGTHVPALGTSVGLVQDVLSIHVVWSICVPIAIVETFSRDRTRPWLSNRGLAVTGAVFAIGSAFLAVAQYYANDQFMASPAQLGGSAAVIAALIALAFTVGRRPARRLDATAPSAWVVGGVAFGVSSLYKLGDTLLPDGISDWVQAAAWFVLVGVLVVLSARWSRSRGWGAAQRLALAGGALLTYVWVGFQQAAALEVPQTTALLGNFIFGASAIALLAAAARAVNPARGAVSRVGRGRALRSSSPCPVPDR